MEKGIVSNVKYSILDIKILDIGCFLKNIQYFNITDSSNINLTNNVNYIITDSSGTRTFILPIDAIVGQIITICLAPNISINYPTIETSNSIQMWVNSTSYLSYTMNSSVIRLMYIYMNATNYWLSI